MRILLTAYKGNMWTVKPFLYLFKKHWGDPKQIDFIAEEDYSNGETNFIKAKDEWIYEGYFHAASFAAAMDWYLQTLIDDHFIFTHADYWITQKVNIPLINDVLNFMQSDSNTMRAEIGYKPGGYIALCGRRSRHDNLDIYECDSSKRDCFLTTSFDMSMWNKHRMAEILKYRPVGTQWSGWNFEIEGMAAYKELTHLRSVMIKPEPVHYMNIIYGRNNHQIKITKELRVELAGFIPSNTEITYVPDGGCPQKCCGW